MMMRDIVTAEQLSVRWTYNHLEYNNMCIWSHICWLCSLATKQISLLVFVKLGPALWY